MFKPEKKFGVRTMEIREIKRKNPQYSSQLSALLSEYQNSPFCQGLRLLDQGAVSNVLQVGKSQCVCRALRNLSGLSSTVCPGSSDPT